MSNPYKQRKEMLERISEKEVQSLKLSELDPLNQFYFEKNKDLEIFNILRAKSPIHHHQGNLNIYDKPYWSVTRYHDILKISKDHETFSSPRPIFLNRDPIFEKKALQSFINLDNPEHQVQRSTVAPLLHAERLKELEQTIRSRTQKILNNLPEDGVVFDWVTQVSDELTSLMSSTLMGYPEEDRHDFKTSLDIILGLGVGDDERSTKPRTKIFIDLASKLYEIWKSKSKQPPSFDFISMILNSKNIKNVSFKKMIGNIILFMVASTETTRNTMTANILLAYKNPNNLYLIKNDQTLIPDFFNETVRMQSPIAGLRRRAKKDIVISNQLIKKNDDVVLWLVSGNRDETIFKNPNIFDINRKNNKSHLSFGGGIHHCMGRRLAELQVKILWEEILKRFEYIDVVEKPIIARSCHLRGYESLMVKVTRKLPHNLKS